MVKQKEKIQNSVEFLEKKNPSADKKKNKYWK